MVVWFMMAYLLVWCLFELLAHACVTICLPFLSCPLHWLFFSLGVTAFCSQYRACYATNSLNQMTWTLNSVELAQKNTAVITVICWSTKTTVRRLKNIWKVPFGTVWKMARSLKTKQSNQPNGHWTSHSEKELPVLIVVTPNPTCTVQ